MSSTKKTSSTQTTTPNAPSWVSPQTQTLSTNTINLSNADPQSYVAGADPLQTQAAQVAGGLTQNAGAYNTANNTLTGMANNGSNPYQVATVHPNSILPNLNAYMSPYLNDVVNASLANYDFGAGQTRAQNALARAASDTFGGSGGDVQDAMSNAKMALDRGQLSYGLLDQGFNTGANLANEDANRRQQAQLANMDAFNQSRQFGLTQSQSAAQNLAALDQSRNADQRANIGLQGDMGSIMQQIAQAKAQAPLSVQQNINSAYGSLIPADSLLTGQTTTGTSKTSSGGLGSVLGGLGSLAMGLGTGGLGLGAGGLFSQLGAGSLSGLRQFGIGNSLSPVNLITH